MSPATRSFLSSKDLCFLFVAPALGACAGLVYCLTFGVGVPVNSALRGVLIGAPILFYERGLFLPQWRDRIRRAATPVFALATMLTYGVLIVGGNGVAGAILQHFGFMDSAHAAMVMSQSGLAYAFVASAAVVFVFRVRDLIGPSVFANLLLGLYHRPISEERVFLFLDVSGSTAFADRFGDLAAQTYLGRIFDALALPVRRSGGSIDDYVGDMALVTWTVKRGLKDAACLRCVADFLGAIDRNAAAWRARFGQVPQFRAALHCGSVVTAEIGLERHKIAYFGDAVNTAARLEALSKSLDVPILVSADLTERLGTLPADFVVEDLGFHAIRGRNDLVAVNAIRLPRAHAAWLPDSVEGQTVPESLQEGLYAA